MDPTMLMWMLRIQETEKLLHKRKAELHAQQQKRAQLELELQAEDQRQSVVRQDLASVNASVEGLTSSRLQLERDISTAREQLAQEQATAGLAAQQRTLEQQVADLTAITSNEQQVQQQYEDSINNHMQEKGARVRYLQDRAQKADAKHKQLLQQEEQLGLDRQLVQLTQQHQQLQAELAQLIDTLTGSKQANVVARAKVAAAVSSTSSELQAAQERCTCLKGRAFQMGRQQAVNDTRLRQLQQEGGRLRQQCTELDQLIARASATIDQLASSCDL